MQKETFLTHLVFEKLEQLKQILVLDENISKIDLENLNFFETFYAYCKDKLGLTIPILVQEAELNNLMNEIDAGTVQINIFLGNSNTGNLNNAINNFNSAITRIKNLPFPISKGDFNFSHSIANFQKIVQDKYEDINRKNEELQKELDALQNQLADKNTLLQNLGKIVTDKETEVQSVLTRYNTEFEALKSAANANVESDRKGFSNSFDEHQRQFQEKFDGLVANLGVSTTTTIDQLNAKLNEAKKLVNVVGDIGVTGNYQNIANQNRASANFWRGAAIVFMSIMTALLVCSIIDLSSKDFNLYKSIIRLIAAAILTYPAIYAATESSKHRKLETRNRNLELELAAVGPFIEMLPEAKKQQIKEELVSKYFGNHISENNSKDEEDVSVGGLEKILKAIAPLINKK